MHDALHVTLDDCPFSFEFTLSDGTHVIVDTAAADVPIIETSLATAPAQMSQCPTNL